MSAPYGKAGSPRRRRCASTHGPADPLLGEQLFVAGAMLFARAGDRVPPRPARAVGALGHPAAQRIVAEAFAMLLAAGAQRQPRDLGAVGERHVDVSSRRCRELDRARLGEARQRLHEVAVEAIPDRAQALELAVPPEGERVRFAGLPGRLRALVEIALDERLGARIGEHREEDRRDLEGEEVAGGRARRGDRARREAAGSSASPPRPASPRRAARCRAREPRAGARAGRRRGGAACARSGRGAAAAETTRAAGAAVAARTGSGSLPWAPRLGPPDACASRLAPLVESGPSPQLLPLPRWSPGCPAPRRPPPGFLASKAPSTSLAVAFPCVLSRSSGS